MTKEAIDKISKNRKGKALGNTNGFKKGQSSWNKGKKCLWVSERNRRLNKINFNGSNSHFWKGGITPKNHLIRNSLENVIWRELVFERDDYTCQKCFSRNGNGKKIKLNSHHILNFSNNEELRFNIDNGITLCRKCHYEFHKIYGFNNNNSEQLCNFLGCVASSQEA